MKTPAYLRQRLRQLFAVKEVRRLPALLVSDQPNVFYFTRFTGNDSWAVLTPRKAVIITDARYRIQAKQESPQARIVVRKGSMIEATMRTLKGLGVRRVGFFGEQMTVALMERLAGGSRSIKWRPCPAKVLYDLRQIKLPVELRAIRKAVAIAQTAFLELMSGLTARRTEAQVAAELEYRMRMHGAEAAAFETIVACGANAAKPHARSSHARLVRGQPIVIDFGATVGRYVCDLTRTVWLGKIAPQFKDIYKICLEAQLEAIAAIKPGERVADIDGISQQVIRRAGYDRYVVHGLGHGIGLDVHERPGLHKRSDVTLKPGMVVTVEPGIYVPGRGGVRIEDDVLVTDRSCRVLSSLPKQMDQVIL